jgi:adenylylsulfate kinase-like enzyme
VPGPRLHILWVFGAPGAGKSVAAWSLFEGLVAAGHRVAYVDIDQLGMLYPAAAEDPERHALKTTALAALVPGYLAAGARTLIVSGVVDVRTGPRMALPPDVDLTMVLLSPDPGVLRQRILARGRDRHEAEEAVAEDALLRKASFVDVPISTAGLSVRETAERLRAHVGKLRSSADAARRMVTSDARMDVLVLTGPRAAGSSTIGFGLATRRWRAGRRTGFVDLQQLGFSSGRDGRVASDATLAIGQLAVLHGLLAERGSGLLVVSGHLSVADRATLRAAVPEGRVTVVRLRADRGSFEEHVRARVGGSAARLAGDDLLDADQSQQDRVVRAALAEQDLLDASAVDDVVVDVSGRTSADVIAEVERRRIAPANPASPSRVP